MKKFFNLLIINILTVLIIQFLIFIVFKFLDADFKFFLLKLLQMLVLTCGTLGKFVFDIGIPIFLIVINHRINAIFKYNGFILNIFFIILATLIYIGVGYLHDCLAADGPFSLRNIDYESLEIIKYEAIINLITIVLYSLVYMIFRMKRKFSIN